MATGSATDVERWTRKGAPLLQPALRPSDVSVRLPSSPKGAEAQVGTKAQIVPDWKRPPRARRRVSR